MKLHELRPLNEAADNDETIEDIQAELEEMIPELGSDYGCYAEAVEFDLESIPGAFGISFSVDDGSDEDVDFENMYDDEGDDETAAKLKAKLATVKGKKKKQATPAQEAMNDILSTMSHDRYGPFLGVTFDNDVKSRKDILPFTMPDVDLPHNKGSGVFAVAWFGRELKGFE